MKKTIRTFFCFLCLSFAVSVQAQSNQYVDSLLRAADEQTSDSGRIKVFNKLANYYMDNNVVKAIGWLEKSYELAVAENNQLLQANNQYSLGYCHYINANYDKALFHYLESVKIYEVLDDSFRLSNALMSIGNVHSSTNNFKKTDEYYDRAENLIRAMNDSFQLVAIFDSRGVMLDKRKQYDSAVYYFKRSIEISKLLGDENNFYSTSNLALTYKHQNKTAEALQIFEDLKQKFIENNVPADWIASVHNNIGSTHLQAKNYALAKENFMESIEISSAANAQSIVMENYKNLASMYEEMGSFEEEVHYLKQYHHLKDSIFNDDNKNRLVELEADYQLEKKNAEILKKDAEVERQTNQRNIFIVITGGILLLLGTGIVFYNRIRKNNALLKEKNIQISEQKNELLTLNHVKDRLFSIISHDLRNPLVTLRSYLALSDNKDLAEEKKLQFKMQTMQAVIQTGDMLDNLLAWANVQIKNTKAVIVPVSVEDLFSDATGHVKAQAFQKNVQLQTDVQVHTVPGDYDILSIAIRNLLTNAIKFSSSGKLVQLSAVSVNSHVHLIVEDQGVGMSEEQIQNILSKANVSSKGTSGEKGSGLGLFLVIELLQKINATLKIESKESVGSKFIVELPGF